ncbi:hypothetical protein E4U51_007695 [Claviceps purpurea]|nr:hypothetical protein E4U51_007695 [Claviceps purpurea]KAG6306871.1 hypothetical protein E4U45_006226 [Claviceps purpurea]
MFSGSAGGEGDWAMAERMVKTRKPKVSNSMTMKDDDEHKDELLDKVTLWLERERKMKRRRTKMWEMHPQQCQQFMNFLWFIPLTL